METWARLEAERIGRFVKWWRDQREAKNGKDWPLWMPPGEWDEEYVMWTLEETSDDR